MPIPKPSTGESQNDYVGRCIRFLENENEGKPAGEKRPHDQIIAICEQSWRDSKSDCNTCIGVASCSTHGKDSGGLSAILARLQRIKDLLVKRFGVAGQAFYESTLARLGVYDPKSQKFNCNLLKSDLKLPFIKSDTDTGFEIENMVLAEGEFLKLDETTHTVSGYANTLVCDCTNDIVLPESYRASAESYSDPIHFMHHLDISVGKIVENKVDEIGWFVGSQPYPSFWPLIKDGTLKGYSIGGSFFGAAKRVGEAWVWDYGVNITDLSYVTRPCNKLSYFETVKSDQKSQSSQMTASGCENSVLSKKEGKKNMPEDKPIETPAIPPVNLSELTNDQLLEHIRTQESNKVRVQLLKVANISEAELLKAKEDQRFTEINTAIGELRAKFDKITQDLATTMTMLKDMGLRMVKMETEPAVKSTANDTAKTVFEKAAAIASGSSSLDEALRQVENQVSPTQ